MTEVLRHQLCALLRSVRWLSCNLWIQVRFGAPNAITPETIKIPSPAVTIPPHQRPAQVTPRRHQLPITLPSLIQGHFLATVMTWRRKTPKIRRTSYKSWSGHPECPSVWMTFPEHLLETLGFSTRKSLDHVHLMLFLSLSQYKPEVASLIHQTPLDLTVVLRKLMNGLDPLNWEKTQKLLLMRSPSQW